LIATLVPPKRAVAFGSSRRLAESDLFGPMEERRFSFVQELDAEALVDRIASISFVAAAPEAEQRRIERELRALVAANGGVVAFPYVTDVYVARAR
jgi:hypothetical protein